MASLDRNLRKDLENAVKKARRVAETGARQAIEQLAVQNHEPWGPLTAGERNLRNRLRAHGRQLGDLRDDRKGTQAIDRLVSECAYEHWHRLLFARFLAENDLLIEPASGMPLSLDECRELAREHDRDWLVLASDFAQRMLPQIFRAGDPVLEIVLPPEKRQELERLLEALPRNVFVEDDSLGWVYQFWQAEQKDAVNSSGVKIGAEQLPAVTQLFTESYMVNFLLHNTLGAWWASRLLSADPEIARAATSENDLRAACSLPGVEWEHLRFVKDVMGQWCVANGSLHDWPLNAREITLLDPCMGSGHFLVTALPILVAVRCREEGFTLAEACTAVLRDNLFGLELDSRCTQIAAFNLALSAWKLGGYRALPSLNLACSGFKPNAKKDDWLKLAGSADHLSRGMDHLYHMFQKAPDLGSLINPHALERDLLVAEYCELQPLLAKAVAQEVGNEVTSELAVVAHGVAKAAELLSRKFTLISTNVPYLGRNKQDDVLKDHCKNTYPDAKADLATCFIERCLDFCASGGTIALVTPQNWLFLGTYKKLRRRLLRGQELNSIARLGPNAFRDMNWWASATALISMSRRGCSADHSFAGLDVSDSHEPDEKAAGLCTVPLAAVSQNEQLLHPDQSIGFKARTELPLLSTITCAPNGSHGADSPRHRLKFWEFERITSDWRPFQTTVDVTMPFGGREHVFSWFRDGREHRENPSSRIQGEDVLGKSGIAVSMMGQLAVTVYTGELFDISCTPIVPNDPAHLPAIWCFCSSPDYNRAVREVDQALKVTNATLVKISFDLSHWQAVAATRYPNGLPKPQSNDPTQWLFNGHPMGSDHPLQVAVARLLNYRWPRQTGSAFPDSPALGSDGLEPFAEDGGIVCLSALRGEPAASQRLRTLLAAAYGNKWSAATLNELLSTVGFAGRSLDDWLRDGFFEQHCELVHQRPFVWHIWDGLKNGFGALVNYHKLAGRNGEGRRTLEKLIYTYLGDWIDRVRAEQKAGVEGADACVAAAEHLKQELEKILAGEPPYDIFVRWKALDRQAVGWEPDSDDGVRMNIRPFMTAKPLIARGKNTCVLRVVPKIKWEKDRGKESPRSRSDYPWFWGWDEQAADYVGGPAFDGSRWNELHYSTAMKLSARARVKSGGKL